MERDQKKQKQKKKGLFSVNSISDSSEMEEKSESCSVCRLVHFWPCLVNKQDKVGVVQKIGKVRKDNEDGLTAIMIGRIGRLRVRTFDQHTYFKDKSDPTDLVAAHTQLFL